MTAASHDHGFRFDNSYARELPGYYVAQTAAQVPAPRLIKLNVALAAELGLNIASLDSAEGAEIFAGNRVPEGALPLAQAYAGHQFGGFSPQLGDGRALLLGEVIDIHGQRRDIQLKGSGRTPFSRGGDGKAALGPVLREYLIGEAMHALGIPTTRALAAVTTGERVRRDSLLPGAVLARVAASHIRVGTFQFFAARGETERVKQLVHYTLARHYPALQQSENPYLALLQAVRDTQAALIARWMQIGFIHGVMNTDNMTLSGETIDYGPCAFMDQYDADTVFSSIDSRGRYAFGNQPNMAQWNLARLAETLLPLIDPDQDRAIALASDSINAFAEHYTTHWLQGMAAKLGLQQLQPDDARLVTDLLELMQQQKADFTLTFRSLADALEGDETPLRQQLRQPQSLDPWLARWQQRGALEAATPTERATRMRQINPLYIARNHQVEAALAAAVENQDYAPFERLLAVLQSPYEERSDDREFASPAPAGFGESYMTFCGT